MKQHTYLFFKFFVSILLVLFGMTGCTTGTREYFRIYPAADQSIADMFERVNRLTSDSNEFLLRDKCIDGDGHYMYRYRVRQEMTGNYRGVHIVVMADIGNSLLIVGYGYEGRRESIATGSKALLDQFIGRLQNQFGVDRVIKMDTDEKSIDGQILQKRMFDGRVDRLSCAQE